MVETNPFAMVWRVMVSTSSRWRIAPTLRGERGEAEQMDVASGFVVVRLSICRRGRGSIGDGLMTWGTLKLWVDWVSSSSTKVVEW